MKCLARLALLLLLQTCFGVLAVQPGKGTAPQRGALARRQDEKEAATTGAGKEDSNEDTPSEGSSEGSKSSSSSGPSASEATPAPFSSSAKDASQQSVDESEQSSERSESVIEGESSASSGSANEHEEALVLSSSGTIASYNMAILTLYVDFQPLTCHHCLLACLTDAKLEHRVSPGC